MKRTNQQKTVDSQTKEEKESNVPSSIEIQRLLCRDKKLNSLCEKCKFKDDCFPTNVGKPRLVSLLGLDIKSLKDYYSWLKGAEELANSIESHKLHFYRNREFQTDVLKTNDRLNKDFDIMKERNYFEGYVGETMQWLEESLKSVASIIQVLEDIRSNITTGKPFVCHNSICDELIREADLSYTCSFCGKKFCKDHALEFLFTIICDDCLDRGCQLCSNKYEDLDGVVHDSRFVKCMARTCNTMACNKCWEVCSTCGGVFCHHHIIYCDECEEWSCNECGCDCGDE